MKKTLVIATVVWIIGGFLMAQPPEADPLERFLFPPELVMRHQAELQLSDQQQEAIIARVQAAQQQFTGLQWKLQREVQRLAQLLQQTRIDEEEMLRQLDQVLSLETQIKKTHLSLVVGIKNLLTEQQQQLLQKLKAQSTQTQKERP